jgi:hypothetical protein
MHGSPKGNSHAGVSRLPFWLKLAYTAFLAVLVPIYWKDYGPSNFLYFCDVVLFTTFFALWLESPLLASLGAVGILLPQILWVLDFADHLAGLKITGMTDYMFNSQIPFFTRGLSLFHGWIPFLLLFLILRLGYDRRALKIWIAIGWGLLLICFFWLPPAGSVLPNIKKPVNINYVFGIHDASPQTWMPAWAWLLIMMAGLPLLVWGPTHLALKKWMKPPKTRDSR